MAVQPVQNMVVEVEYDVGLGIETFVSHSVGNDYWGVVVVSPESVVPLVVGEPTVGNR